MNTELVWFSIPIVMFLWQAGGTWNKIFRRILAPIFLMSVLFLFLGFKWYFLLFAPLLLAAASLPFTLIGDSVHDNWINWPWIWVHGYLSGLPIVAVGAFAGPFWECLLFALGTMAIRGVCETMSNIKGTSKLFVWKLCEGMAGLAVSLPVCWFVQFARWFR